jgi:hypothetical protein
MMRATIGRDQFTALVERRLIVLQIPGHPNVELVLADIDPDSLLELHLTAMQRPIDPPQAVEFLPARRRKIKR